MAHWSTSAEPSRSVVTMLQELDAAGFETVLVSAAEGRARSGGCARGHRGSRRCRSATTVLRRANVGYDFGSWASVLAAFPGVAAASRVLLVNDSLIGPFAPLAPILADFEVVPDPGVGAVGVAAAPAARAELLRGVQGRDPRRIRRCSAFWSDIRVESRKAKIVRYNELGLSEALDEAGIGWRDDVRARTGRPAEPDHRGLGPPARGGLPLREGGGWRWVAPSSMSSRSRRRRVRGAAGPRRSARLARPETLVSGGPGHVPRSLDRAGRARVARDLIGWPGEAAAARRGPARSSRELARCAADWKVLWRGRT